ncbi:MAG: tetratricopeptide repeat protein [Bacteroidales bacterium]
MWTSTVFLACCLLLGGLPAPATDLVQQLQAVRDLVQAKKFAEAITEYEKLLRDAPKSLQGPIQFEIAALHAVLGNRDRALVLMDQAVQSGFDDCAAVEREELKPLGSDLALDELFSRIRISEADLRELSWLKTELLNVSHETKMMITENTTRVDTGITVVSQSAMPVRDTDSPGVLFNRELLKMMHQAQRRYVMEADKLRMSHVTKMTIISGARSAQQVALSSSYAQRNAEQRKLAIDARRFALVPGVGTTPRPCSAWK